MFPDRVGHLVLDSPVDLSATPTRGAATKRRRLRARARRLPRRLRRATRSCPFHRKGDPPRRSAALQTRFETGSDAADHRPVTGKRGQRRAGVATFYTASDLRPLRQAVRLADSRRRAATAPPRVTARSPIPRRQLQRAARRRHLRQHRRGRSASSSATTATTRSRRSTSSALSTRTRCATYPFLGSYVGSTPARLRPSTPAAATVGGGRRRAGH